MEEEIPALGLVMMVKDESAFINQTLASVKPYIDFWTIVDTGTPRLSGGPSTCPSDVGLPGWPPC